MRYFFHMQTLTRYTDVDGLEMDSPADAREEAIRACGELLRDCPAGFWNSRPWSVTVTDAAGLILWDISIDGATSAAAPA